MTLLAGLFLLRRIKGDDDVFGRVFSERLHRVFLFEFHRGGGEGDLLSAFFFSGFDSDGLGIDPFEFCERLTDVLFAAPSGDACHAHLVGGRFVAGQPEAGQQQRDNRCQDVDWFHVVI